MTNSVPNYDPVDVCVHSHDDHMITEWDQWDYNHDQMLGNRFAEIYTQSAVFNVYDIRGKFFKINSLISKNTYEKLSFHIKS